MFLKLTEMKKKYNKIQINLSVKNKLRKKKKIPETPFPQKIIITLHHNKDAYIIDIQSC